MHCCRLLKHCRRGVSTIWRTHRRRRVGSIWSNTYMCGVIGYVGPEQNPRFFYNGLKRLEYRGYDSAGIAMVEGGEIHVVKAEGKLSKLEAELHRLPEGGIAGIGHTRWATHGKPSVENAHPHDSGPIVLLHNGIIENYAELKETLIEQGDQFRSETDTEVVAHLIHRHFSLHRKGSPHERMMNALSDAIADIRGMYALAILCKECPGYLYIAKYGSPLVIGKGKGENFIASGIAAMVEHTTTVTMLEDGDWGFITADEIAVKNASGVPVQRDFFEVN